MAKVFLDTSIFIDIYGRKVFNLPNNISNKYFLSPLTYCNFFYISKLKTPNNKLNTLISLYSTVPLTNKLIKTSLQGPTNDLEDNIQLHSAVEADCDTFLTNDKKLLKLGYFGKTKIQSTI